MVWSEVPEESWSFVISNQSTIFACVLHMCMCGCVCSCVGRPEVDIKHLPLLFFIFCLKASRWTWELTSSARLADREFQGFPCVHPPSTYWVTWALTTVFGSLHGCWGSLLSSLRPQTTILQLNTGCIVYVMYFLKPESITLPTQVQ